MSDKNRYKTDGTVTPYLFDAVLYPNRSLSRDGLIWLMIVLLGCSLAIGVMFWSRGAWPVTGFYGLEILVVWLAFRANNKAGQDYETIRLTKDRLVVEDHSNRQGQKCWVFSPAWVKIDIKHPNEFEGILTITAHGRGVAVGSFLSMQEREEVAKALRTALSRTS